MELKIINPENLLNQVRGKENLFDNLHLDYRTRTIIRGSKVPVGILIDKGLNKAEQIFIPLFSQKDAFLMGYVQKWIRNSGAQISIVNSENQIHSAHEIKESIRTLGQYAPNHIQVIKEQNLSQSFLSSQDLMVVSFEGWKKLTEAKNLSLTEAPSVLIIHAIED